MTIDFDRIAACLRNVIAYVGGDSSRGRGANIDVRVIRTVIRKTKAR